MAWVIGVRFDGGREKFYSRDNGFGTLAGATQFEHCDEPIRIGALFDDCGWHRVRVVQVQERTVTIVSVVPEPAAHLHREVRRIDNALRNVAAQARATMDEQKVIHLLDPVLQRAHELSEFIS